MRARFVKTVLNVSANEKWRSAKKFQESQSATVSELFDHGVPSPCLEEEIEPASCGDHSVMSAVAFFNSSPLKCSLESARIDDARCQPTGTGTLPPMTMPPTPTQNCECPALNVRTNLVWQDEAHPHHCTVVSQTCSDPFSTPPDGSAKRRASRASLFEEETETKSGVPPLITPGTRTSSPASIALSDLGNCFQNCLCPTASVPTLSTTSEANTTINAECNTMMDKSSADHITSWTAKFVDQFEFMNHNSSLLHVARALKLHERA
jgi:hypothetical protein